MTAPSTISPRATGRPTQQQVEERRAIGQFAHVIEGQVFTISARAIDYRSRAAIRQLHDADHDVNLVAAGEIVAACPNCRHTAGPRIQAAMDADSREDAVAIEGDGLVLAIHAVSRRVAGWIERACIALRGRPAARTTGAVQQIAMEMEQ